MVGKTKTATRTIQFKETVDSTFDFKEADNGWGAHGIHPYPAMMIYPIARRLIHEYSEEGDRILDPFVGSGTVLLESVLHNRDSIGFDINPLALLIAKVKLTPLPAKKLYFLLTEILETHKRGSPKSVTFHNINFWFKPDVIEALSLLLSAIGEIEDEKYRNFFLIAFSETVRRASNTRNSEFKLYRRRPQELAEFRPDVAGIFKDVSSKNIFKLSQTYRTFPQYNGKAEILEWDSRNRPDMIGEESVDLILTSPPYGDSRTTVAYGQFSRLFLQWIGAGKRNIDKESLGGTPTKESAQNLESEVFRDVIRKIADCDEKRAAEVRAFFEDFAKCFSNFVPLIKRGGYLCLVVGNRRVKRITIPTDTIFAEMGLALGLKHINTIIRNIPNKRMPRMNSPTNIRGETEVTINTESIVMMRKG
ncbi:MAG: site-specific DNA-methyltransferase [Myxococcota bacterium]